MRKTRGHPQCSTQTAREGAQFAWQGTVEASAQSGTWDAEQYHEAWRLRPLNGRSPSTRGVLEDLHRSRSGLNFGRCRSSGTLPQCSDFVLRCGPRPRRRSYGWTMAYSVSEWVIYQVKHGAHAPGEPRQGRDGGVAPAWRCPGCVSVAHGSPGHDGIYVLAC